MSVAKDRRGDVEWLTDRGFGGSVTAIDEWPDVSDENALTAYPWGLADGGGCGRLGRFRHRHQLTGVDPQRAAGTVIRVKAIRRFTVRTVLPEPLLALTELASNLRWSWHPETRDVFEAVDPQLWQQYRDDPVGLLGAVSPSRLDTLANDVEFVARVNRAAADLQSYLSEDRWYQGLDNGHPESIAYFSPEFGIAAALPQYSGGLGILAGDHLKAASDLGIPIIGVGLFYRSGYFRQSFSRDGWQIETYPVFDPDALPVSLLREADGRGVRVSLELPGERSLSARVWVAHVGRTPLLLLDSDVEENAQTERDVTDRLYGGGGESRLTQELLLGVGGVRALRAYCRLTGTPDPEVFHTNEGHAGFLGIERIRELIADGLTFEEALQVVRAGTVFTTHTPVPAGIDKFARETVANHFQLPEWSSVPLDRLLALGADASEPGGATQFNMAVMGLSLAQRANGVSSLHGRVSRSMFSSLWPTFDLDEVPITSITNGVHGPTWVAREVRDLAVREIGPHILDGVTGWDQVGQVSDSVIWSTKRVLRERLVTDARDRLRKSWSARGASDAELSWVSGALDPDMLTIGFARRVPSYKRLTLMLRDPARLRALLLDPDRPVQIVIAGKSHPDDVGGKRLIQEMVRFADEEDVRHRIAFLPDYDIGMAQILYPGCDVWLNNPLRPLEACGTSGMKAALNGALNLSIRDGWWDEWFDGENGWAIPTADGVHDDDHRDDLEAAALYTLIEKYVAPTFYELDGDGMPARWIAMVRHTLTSLGPKVLAGRMLGDYVRRLYLPAAQSARRMKADSYALARDLAPWIERVRWAWPHVQLEHVEASGVGDEPHLGQQVTVRAVAVLGSLTPDDVVVQVAYGRVDSDDRLVGTTLDVFAPVEAYDDNRWLYEAKVTLDRTGPFGYTARVVPRRDGLSSAVELGLQTLPMVQDGL